MDPLRVSTAGGVQIVISPKANSYTQLPTEGEADSSPTLVLATQVCHPVDAAHSAAEAPETSARRAHRWQCRAMKRCFKHWQEKQVAVGNIPMSQQVECRKFFRL